MRKKYLAFSLLALLPTFGFAAAKQTPTFGIVNFASCAVDSKFGKKEQQSFEAMRNQFSSMIESTEQQLKDKGQKLQDPDYMDTLSPEAEKELKMQVQQLQEEMGRYQGQFYQAMNQANMRMLQSLAEAVSSASQKVAKKEGISVILNKEACFYYDPTLDITKKVINQMDTDFESADKGSGSK